MGITPSFIKSAVRTFAARHRSLQSAFAGIYTGGDWAQRQSESLSGIGSTLDATANIRRWLPELIRERRITSMLDIPCGDWNWMRHVALGCAYIGADIVPQMIAANRSRFPGVDFRVLDASKDELPKVDLVMLRHCTIHLPNSDALAVLENIKASRARWLLVTDSPDIAANADLPYPGPHYRALNLQLPPFRLSAPVRHYDDDTQPDGRAPGKMGLWDLSGACCPICKLPIEAAQLDQHLDFEHETVLVDGVPVDKEFADQYREMKRPSASR